ncbi:MAG: sugar transferase, partial [Oscillospiraceae bacterium]|nr:sugar transferase [Oscillospiraceae bacterium]
PRPELPFYVEQFKEEIPLYMVKHQVRPGITGWAQVNGYRGDTSVKERIRCDVYYIENWTLLFDIKILFMTLFKGIKNQEKLR